MKEFKVRSGNFLKSSNSTSNMMYTILVVLIPFIIFSTYKNGIYPIIKGYGNLYLVFKPLIFASVASLFCIVTEYLYYYIKKDKRSFYKLFSESYAMFKKDMLSRENRPMLLGKTIYIDEQLLYDGKENGFWHCSTMGQDDTKFDQDPCENDKTKKQTLL